MIGQNQDNRSLLHVSWHGGSSNSISRKYGFDPFGIRDTGVDINLFSFARYLQQLNLKIKGLLTELDEIRAQRETAGLQSDHVGRRFIRFIRSNQTIRLCST